MTVTLDTAVLLDNLWHTTPPKKITITPPLAELLLQHELHNKLYHLELIHNCWELWPLSEWQMFVQCDKVWTVFWDKYRSKQQFLELSPREQQKKARELEQEKRISDLEDAKIAAIIAGDKQKLQMIELALILNRTKL